MAIMENIPNGIIIILHQGFTAINEQDCINALPEKWRALQRKTVRVKYSKSFGLADGQEINFLQFAYEHKQQFRREILPLIEKNKDHVIAYFGLVPVPLGIDFGHLFFNFNTIEVFQWHHKEKVWYQEIELEEVAGDSTILPPKLPATDQKGLNDVLIRLSLAHQVMSHTTDEVLPNAAEIDIAFKKPNEDAIVTRDKMTEVGQLVQRTLDQLAENESDIDVIHLFAAIPCGPAFLIGTKISPNVHPFVQTYQYKNTSNPKYQKAILVKQKLDHTAVIKSVDRTRANELRRLADTELRSNIREFCMQNEQEANDRQWPKDVIYFKDKGIMNEPLWSELPPIYQTKLQEDSCRKQTETIENGVKRFMRKWHIDDYFLSSLSKRLETDEEITKALRLFFFHEVLHDVEHDLGNGKAENIESFPKVLEIADYQADVYALLNEYGYNKYFYGNITEKNTFFLEAIKMILETAWGQLEEQAQLEHIQVRHLNRFLIWHWQYIRIQQAENTTDDILKILEEKPYIELAGLRSFEKNGRFYFHLDERQENYLEMAIFYKNQVIRQASASNFKIENLIEGIKSKDSERVFEELSRFYPKD